MKLDLAPFRTKVEEGLLRVQKHPTLPLLIWNYSEICQFSKAWDDITLMCRGLVTDTEGNIVARPFKKFFNYEEHQGPLPNGEPEIIEKVDGSLGIVFYYEGHWHVATRGSFNSEQSNHAELVLLSKYGHLLEDLQSDQTHLFEILFKTNRIVVDYGDLDDLVYLGSIDTDTGFEAPGLLAYDDSPWRQPRKFGGVGWTKEALTALEKPNSEGFVLRWPGGFRLKFKFEEYKRLHKILTGTTERTIWEALSKGQGLNEILEVVPDEFYKWVEETVFALKFRFREIESAAEKVFETCRPIRDDRKSFALQAVQYEHSGLLFGLLDDENIDPMIWRLIKPKATKPFKIET